MSDDRDTNHDAKDTSEESRKKHQRGSEALREILGHAQGEIRTQLRQAIEQQQKTGRKLMEILRQDVDREMFKGIWEFLHNPVSPGKGQKSGKKKVKDQLSEEGWINADELEEMVRSDETFDAEIGQRLVDNGYISEEQLKTAQVQHERTGQSVWRILVNTGKVSPKQIADVRKYGDVGGSTTGDTALKEACQQSGVVTEEECETAMEQSRTTGRNILQVLVDSGTVDKHVLGEAISDELDVDWIGLTSADIDQESAELLPEHLARKNRMIPFSHHENTVRIAMANPRDPAARESFRMLANMEVEPVLAFEEDIIDVIDDVYNQAPSVGTTEKHKGALARIRETLKHATPEEEEVVSLAQNAGVISLVASIVEGAINSRATDIHLEPQADALRVRYRIDGLLYDIMNLPEGLHDEVISRVKVLANLDITERRRPQDGHFTIDVREKEYDIRVATLPTVLGEKMVLRLLNPEDLFRGMRELGLQQDQLDLLEDSISDPYGMILATGPIGSGKTTTLYALLSEVDILTQNVVTIEDPVEYQLPGINQVQVDRQIDRTFASMLRSVLRQDANVMMVGEVRDAETANVAVGAARTGHLLLSTMHTNDAAGAIITLEHLGVPKFLIANSVTTVVAQRLVRRLCPHCKEEGEPEQTLLETMELDRDEVAGMEFYQARGCDECYQMGYKGRTGIFEVMRISPNLHTLVLHGADRGEIIKCARKDGMITLQEAGLHKVQQGITTLEEVARVTKTSTYSVLQNKHKEGVSNA
ncbi:MAG: ATPase, T2SS/T4P/T4SS family [Planctomycetota bacterium]